MRENIHRDFEAEVLALERGENSLRPARVKEYADFLIKHLENGGKISHTYDYPYPRTRIQMATVSAQIPKGCGAKAINVIVPEGVEITRIGNHDHGNSYMMADGSVQSMTRRWTPIYPDVAEVMQRKGWSFAQDEFGANANFYAVNMLINGRTHFKTQSDDYDGPGGAF